MCTDRSFPTPSRPTSPGTSAHTQNELNCLLPTLILIHMSADLIRRFYTSCPLYLWPVLWVQVILINAKLAHYRACAGGEEIDCFIGLSRRGTLHIVWLSDNATGHVAPDAWRPVYRALPNTLEPLLRRMPESQTSALIGQVKASQSQRSRPTPGIRTVGVEIDKLAPG
jgi:hypothetical protein